jgi:hypothetical protein
MAMQGRELLAGRYELRDVLGFGGMAEVRDGWDTRLNRAVAVKLLHPGLSSQADIRQRFKIEACAAATGVGRYQHLRAVADQRDGSTVDCSCFDDRSTAAGTFPGDRAGHATRRNRQRKRARRQRSRPQDTK